jgi:hypothetical protein
VCLCVYVYIFLYVFAHGTRYVCCGFKYQTVNLSTYIKQRHTYQTVNLNTHIKQRHINHQIVNICIYIKTKAQKSPNHEPKHTKISNRESDHTHLYQKQNHIAETQKLASETKNQHQQLARKTQKRPAQPSCAYTASQAWRHVRTDRHIWSK